jgi:hypothetical protein
MEHVSDPIEISLAMDREVASFWKLLPQQAVRIFVTSSLPWAARIAEIDLDASRDAELEVVSEFLSSIPR